MVKKHISVCIVVIFIFSICGCAQSTEDTPIAETENVNTENAEIEDDTYEMQDWQIVYAEYIENIKYAPYNEYALIYVDEDDIPELVVYTGTFADACIVLTFHNGEVDTLQTGSLQCNYIEKKNFYWDTGGHMGEFYDHVYTVEDGKWVYVAGGEYIAKDLLIEEYDYIWDGEAVSEDEYYENLRTVYDIDKNQNVGYEKQFEELDEMLVHLHNAGKHGLSERDKEDTNEQGTANQENNLDNKTK